MGNPAFACFCEVCDDPCISVRAGTFWEVPCVVRAEEFQRWLVYVSFARKSAREMEQWMLTIEVPDTLPETWTPLFTNSRIMGVSFFEDFTVFARFLYFSWGHTDGSNLTILETWVWLGEHIPAQKPIRNTACHCKEHAKCQKLP